MDSTLLCYSSATVAALLSGKKPHIAVQVWGNEIQRERERERKTRWRVYCEASQRLLVPVGEPGGLHLEAGHRSLGPQGNLSNVGKGAWEESVRISHAMNHNKTLSIYVRCVNPFIL
ncbi:hypothetical protein JOB18_011442 [Solea senegalensis]|uniref:Uncharacterized protein n=1 Tax=Solea senegalensis TaxID=28829 RepID=A0AAV6SCD6_SOLSE|nr:hypothetical protein JOB18_011442 [Solea senegalensis]